MPKPPRFRGIHAAPWRWRQCTHWAAVEHRHPRELPPVWGEGSAGPLTSSQRCSAEAASRYSAQVRPT
eukprot:3676900-Lingulodinium_polyedra.AAC.1